jgi:aminocarboxymuconate-semialdehyde decarboxylase
MTSSRAPSEYLRDLYFDALVYQPAPLAALVAQVGAGQVMVGTDYPFDMGIEDPVDRLAAAPLDDAAREAIRGGNAARLGLVPAPS